MTKNIKRNAQRDFNRRRVVLEARVQQEDDGSFTAILEFANFENRQLAQGIADTMYDTICSSLNGTPDD